MVNETVSSRTTLYVRSVIWLSGIGATAIVVIVRYIPLADRASTIATVIGFLMTIITALIAGAIQQVHLGMNSRLTELVDATRKAAFEGGRAIGRQDSDQEYQAADRRRTDRTAS